MILNKVTVKNYRQYRDVVIDFAKEDGKNFTIIQGKNGTGKTTLLNALSWCLYGEEVHTYKETDNSSKKKGLTICNNKTENLALIGDEIEVRVELEFIDEGKILAFNRVWGFIKTKNGLRREGRLDKFELKTEEDHNIVISDSPYYTIERKIPKEIEDYFFFDGGRLNIYFNSTKNKEIRDAVYRLSQLNLLENATKDLEYVKSKYITEQRKISPRLGGVNEKINDLENKIQESKTKLQEAEKQIEEVRNEIERIDEELINKKSTNVQNDAKRNKELDGKIFSHADKIAKIESKLRKHIFTKYPFIMSYESFVKFLELGEESREKGYIPPKFKKSFIKDLLDSGKCICGTDLNVDIEHRMALEKLLEETNPLTDNAEDLTVALNIVKDVLMDDINKFRDISVEYHKEINSLKKERNNFISEKNDIEARLKANPVKEVNKLINRRKDLKVVKNNLDSKIANLKSSIERYERSLGEQKKLLNQQERLSKEFSEYQKKIDFCKDKIKASNEIYIALKDKMRERIQNLTKDKFLKLSWKKDAFVDIIIDEDYDVYVVNSLGELVIPNNLSQGEKLSLSPCFMSALHNISGFNLPIIMDTPAGILDEEMMLNMAKFLPEFSGGKQMVLLVTDKEYNPDVRQTLLRTIGKEYKIKLGDNFEEGNESKVILDG